MITNKQDSSTESPLVRFLLVLFTAVSLITTVICIYASPHFPDPGFTLSDGYFFVVADFFCDSRFLLALTVSSVPDIFWPFCFVFASFVLHPVAQSSSGEGGNIDLDEFYDHQNERPKILQDQHQGR